ncbi:MAG: ferric reductase-like transmembrane domain-containing protein, partial [Alphaproteobacteria bacterium]|nr:ferric reductase-like transmembrane domain-containing protein [Alphaproteobacteria bacterium]
MESRGSRRIPGPLVWAVLLVVAAVPVVAAAFSPLLAWREPVYIAAGFAGIVAMALLLFQPLLAGGYVPDLPTRISRRMHRLVGTTLVLAVVVHVGGLWITSPPDVVDALLFRSPTFFSAWGVIAMWAVFGAALFALPLKRLRLQWWVWRAFHTSLAALTVVGSVVHALLIEGTMEPVTKVLICIL